MKELYFIHIPKTAGMTIENIFYNFLKKQIGYSFFNNYKHKEILKKEYNFIKISKWHIPMNYLNKKLVKEIKNNHYIFTIVRNPFDRIVSTFKFWIDFKEKHKNSTNKHFINLINQINGIYKSFDKTSKNLNDFIKKVLIGTKYKFSLDGHLLPMYLYVYLKINNKLTKIPKVLKYENLNDEFNKLVSKHAPKIPQNILKKTFINKSEGKLNRNDLNEESINLIKKYYKFDFKYFNYDYNL